jgi:hypothetical protein
MTASEETLVAASGNVVVVWHPKSRDQQHRSLDIQHSAKVNALGWLREGPPGIRPGVVGGEDRVLSIYSGATTEVIENCANYKPCRERRQCISCQQLLAASAAGCTAGMLLVHSATQYVQDQVQLQSAPSFPIRPCRVLVVSSRCWWCRI